MPGPVGRSFSLRCRSAQACSALPDGAGAAGTPGTVQANHHLRPQDPQC